MEKGAAKRFTASHIKNSYVLAWRMWFDIHYIKEISISNFSPPPRVDSALVLIMRKKKPFLSNQDQKAFWGLAEYVMKYPKAKVNHVLREIFTTPQFKHLKRKLNLDSESMISSLTEEQWAMVYKTMIQFVPKPFWPRLKKKKRDR